MSVKSTTANTASLLCPACGEGTLSLKIESHTVEHAGQRGEVPLRISTCNACGSELATAEDALANKRAMIAFQKQAEGLLTGEAVRQWRKQYGLSQQQAAVLLGGGKVGFSRYENDDIIQSTAMDNLLRLCQQDPSVLVRLARIRQLELSENTLRAIDAERTKALGQLMPILRQEQGAISAQRRQPTDGPHQIKKSRPVYLERLLASRELYSGSAAA
jgi:HTH-type transcriptional regulator/antitoxin MqsA